MWRADVEPRSRRERSGSLLAKSRAFIARDLTVGAGRIWRADVEPRSRRERSGSLLAKSRAFIARDLTVGADRMWRADVAQLVEHSLGKGEVTSSILVIGSRN